MLLRSSLCLRTRMLAYINNILSPIVIQQMMRCFRLAFSNVVLIYSRSSINIRTLCASMKSEEAHQQMRYIFDLFKWQEIIQEK